MGRVALCLNRVQGLQFRCGNGDISSTILRTVKPCHPFVKEIIEEELQERGWRDPAMVIAELAKVSRENVDRLLTFSHRLTGLECWIMDKAFGLSDGFFSRFQKGCEKNYPSIV